MELQFVYMQEQSDSPDSSIALVINGQTELLKYASLIYIHMLRSVKENQDVKNEAISNAGILEGWITKTHILKLQCDF